MVIKSVPNPKAIYRLPEAFSKDIGTTLFNQKKKSDFMEMVMFSPLYHSVVCQALLTMV
jgi:hypothetical protein